MRRLLPLTLLLAIAACGKPAASTGSGAPPPSDSGQSGPSDPGPIDPATVGTISGVVKLEGWLKPDGIVPIGQNAYCSSLHPNGPPQGDSLVLGDGQAMANVFVQVKSGLGRRRFSPPGDPVILDQKGCIYSPHVVSLMANQPLLVRNSDETLHNIHGSPKLSAVFNFGQASKGMEATVKIPLPEPEIVVKCDVHSWMNSIIHVTSHPFHCVTGKDGVFKLEGLPPGEYEIEARHERFPKSALVQRVKLEPKGAVKCDFTFKGGTKP